MRTVGSVEEAGEFVVLEDARGRVCQQVPGGDFTYRDERGAIQSHRRDPGWWDMRMEYRINPQQIEFPATVVWESTKKQGA